MLMLRLACQPSAARVGRLYTAKLMPDLTDDERPILLWCNMFHPTSALPSVAGGFLVLVLLCTYGENILSQVSILRSVT